VGWSTREIAELAGTTVRAVRHYHEVGLLPEPERRSNGYKQYGVAHLVRVLRIKRLTDLGFSLPQIAAMGDADEHPAEELRALDAELAATIERLQRVRAELGEILRHAAPTDLPPEFAPAAAEADLSDADRSFLVVMSRVLGPKGLQTYADVLQNLPVSPSLSAFDDLPADADEQTRQELAERFVLSLRDLLAEHPGLLEVHADAPGGTRFAEVTAGRALQDLYNVAQLDVLRRTSELLGGEPRPGGTAPRPSS
jgi:DNA-binding transcriptional MerR regulator